MNVAKLIAQAQSKVAYWSAKTGAAARRWLKYWESKLAYLKGILTPTPPQPPTVSAPTAPVLGSTSVASSIITVPVTTASTHVDGISGYQVWRGTSSGAEAYIEDTETVPYVSPGLAAGTYYFKFKGITTFGVVSAFSNEVSATISGALGADTHAPATPSAPTNVSGGGATLASVASITPTSDDSTYSATEVVSGSDHVAWYDNGTNSPAKDSYVPSASAESLEDIGTHRTGTGTDDGSTLASVNYTSGDGLYGTEDSGFTFKRGATKGKVTLFIKPTAATASAYWGKPIGLMVRATSDPQSAYLNTFLFASGGAKAIATEWRDSNGAQASQATAVAYTTMPWLKLVYDPDTDVAVTSYSTDSTNGTDGTWTTHATHTISAIGSNYLSGKFGSDGGTATYTNYSRTVDTAVRYAFTGTQQTGSTTTRSITARVVDAAGNASTASSATVWTFDALSSGGGGGGVTSGPHAYPRKGGFCGGGDGSLASSSDRDWLATLNFVILGGNYHGFFPNANGQTRQQVHDDIKSRSATKGTGIKIAQYNDLNEYNKDYWYFNSWGAIVNAANWHLYQSGTSGAHTRSAFDYPQFYLINLTRFAGTYAGLYPYQSAANWVHNTYIGGIEGASHVSTSIDYHYLDNLYLYPQIGGSDPADWLGFLTLPLFQSAESDFMTYGRSLDSTRGWGGNVACAYAFEGGEYTNLRNMSDCGLMEHDLGENNYEYYSGTLRWLEKYKFQADNIMRASDSPFVVEYENYDYTNGKDNSSDTAYQGARYAQALCAMGPGYFYSTTGAGNFAYGSQSIEDFDELIGGSLNQRGWLGTPTEPQQTAPRISGSVVYRDFTNGRVYVNCRGASAVTIDLTGFVRLTGTQNGTVNNGATGGTYSLPPKDGLFVRRA